MLISPSGCGKSTTERLIAGPEEITSGTIFMPAAGMSISQNRAELTRVRHEFPVAAYCP
jgi:ABC-type Fe3+/spermidine/putrescine transport system ATPase subunit